MRRTSLLLLCLCAVLSVARAQVLPANEIKDPELSALQAAQHGRSEATGRRDSQAAHGLSFLPEPQARPRRRQAEVGRPALHSVRSLQRQDRAEDHRQLLRGLFRREDELRPARPANLSADRSPHSAGCGAPLPEELPACRPTPSRFPTMCSAKSTASLSSVPKIWWSFFRRRRRSDLVNAKDDTARQAALMRGEVFVNAKPATIWLSAEGPQIAQDAPPDDPSTAAQSANSSGVEARSQRRAGYRQTAQPRTRAHLEAGQARRPSQAAPRYFAAGALCDAVCDQADSRRHGEGTRSPGAFCCLRFAQLHRIPQRRLP